MNTDDLKAEAISDAQDHLIWASSAPKWIHLTGYGLSLICASTLKINKAYIAAPLELLPLWAGLLGVVAIASLTLVPILIVNWSCKTWLRRFYPDVEALRWNAQGVTFKGYDIMPWSRISGISVRELGKKSDREIEFQIKPLPDQGGEITKFVIPLVRLRKCERVLQQLESSAKAHAVHFFTSRDFLELIRREKSKQKSVYMPYWKTTPSGRHS